jgi:Phosphate-selective porin O and P
MIRPIHTTTTIVCIFLFTTSLSMRALAQETAPAPKLAASDTEALRQRLEKLEAMVHQLEQTVQSQSQLIERQNGQLQALQQSMGANPTMITARYERPSPESTTTMTPPNRSAKTRIESPAPETPAPSAPAQDSKFSKVDAGFGTIMFNGLLQGWYAAGNGGFRDTFKIRRAEPGFSGQITPKVRWALMFDFSKALSSNNTFTTINGQQALRDTSIDQGSRILEDAFITLDYIKNVHVNVGQFKLPLSLEGIRGQRGSIRLSAPCFCPTAPEAGGWEMSGTSAYWSTALSLRTLIIISACITAQARIKMMWIKTTRRL